MYSATRGEVEMVMACQEGGFKMNTIASRKVLMAIDFQEGGFKMHAIANTCIQLPLGRFAK
jgi:hypothetical protein